MRNPVRLKNLQLRFLPVATIALASLLWLAPDREAVALGIGLIALGLALRTWGAGHLVKRERLTVSGPYTHLRHPLYAGTLLIGSGFAFALGGQLAWLLLAGLLVWFFGRYFPDKERRESDLLERRFGAAYVHYRGQVRALLPRWSVWRPSPEHGATICTSGGWQGQRYAANNELGTLLAVVAGCLLLVLRASA